MSTYEQSLSYRIPAHGQLVVGVLFNPVKWDGEIFPLGKGLPSEEAQANYKARGLQFVATFGFLQGKFCSAFECPLDGNAVEFLSRAYAEWVYATLTKAAPAAAQTCGDGVDWLRKLYRLPDVREN
jgi:hypothetical protein